MKKNGSAAWIALLWVPMLAWAASDPTTQPLNALDQRQVPQWGVFETALNGPSDGNPFLDVQLSATFTSHDQSLKVLGFYDGDGVYRIRFMPPALGDWHYTTQSNRPALSNKSGDLTCVAPEPNNHGPVRVQGEYHFAYADGTPYILMGTTIYGWTHEPQPVADQTLKSLAASPFNKVRLELLTKSEPLYAPYAHDGAGQYDQERFNPDYFRHLEWCVKQMGDLGVEADLILFNPYHKGDMAWFDQLDDKADERYLTYVVSRLSAFHNVWWSMANEYGQVKNKTDDDWDEFFKVLVADDPYVHLRSIHNALKVYDYNKPWVTHASIQNPLALGDFGRAVLYRDMVRKPIVFDEVGYEGDIPSRWGRHSGQEMTKRFWLATIAGVYVTHGETFTNPPGGIAWTARGGQLIGTSPPRIAFLKKILEAGPRDGIEPIDQTYETHVGGRAGEYYLYYFGAESPTEWRFGLPRADAPNKKALDAGMKFRVDILDTWNMTITPVDQVFTIDKFVDTNFLAVGDPRIALPGKPWLALRITRVR